jgi:hypothetical protein
MMAGWRFSEAEEHRADVRCYRRLAILALQVTVLVRPLLACHAARALVNAAANSSTEESRGCGLRLVEGTLSEIQESLAE